MFQKEDPDFLAALNQQNVPTTQVTPKPGTHANGVVYTTLRLLCSVLITVGIFTFSVNALNI